MVLRLRGMVVVSVTLAVLCASQPVALAAGDGPRPAGRLQAVAALSGGSGAQVPCLAPLLSSPGAGGRAQDLARVPTPTRRALAILSADPALAGERRFQDALGTVVRWSGDRSSLDRLDAADADSNGIPDAAEAAAAGVAAAKRILALYEFPSPGPLDVVLARLGSGVEGLTVPGAGREGRTVILLESASRAGLPALRRAAAHQYAHAVAAAMGPGVPASWGEALATWIVLALDASDERTLAPLARRFERLSEGLGSDDLDLAAGNAAWLSFLEASYGPTALRLAFDEIARGGGAGAAMDRALRRAAGVSFAEGFREFHLWTMLVGARADGRHFPFASRLPSPEFASEAQGLPAVSVLADPAVAPAGATAVRIDPVATRGGMTVRVEGEVGARWEADLLLLRGGRPPHRLPLPIGASGQGEVVVPLDGLLEALLLVRNVDPEERGSRRFTWSAFRDAAYPYELDAFEVSSEAPGGGVYVSWETLSEAGVLGFNVLRTRENFGLPVRLNPVWVPAVGDRSTSARYQFFDPTAEPGVTYDYRVEGITPEGLTSLSEPASVTAR